MFKGRLLSLSHEHTSWRLITVAAVTCSERLNGGRAGAALRTHSPDVAVVDVEGQAQDAQQDPEAGEDGHGREKLLGQIAELLDHHGPVGRRPCTCTARRRERDRGEVEASSPSTCVHMDDFLDLQAPVWQPHDVSLVKVKTENMSTSSGCLDS